MKLGLTSAVLALAWAAAPMAQADVEEVRIGVAHHDIRTDHGELADPKEDGPNVEGELVFTSPDWIKWLGAPRPYVMGSFNTQGNTSFGGVGLYWRWEFADNWAFEPGFGYVVHNGEIDTPAELVGTPAAGEFEREHQLLGSRDLFRSSFALEREMGPRTAWQLYFQHLSHGQILAEGRNQGLNEAGVRFIYRFNPDAAD
jgi:lipid A 3-O-deacylase